jgi:hypothetical protein
MKRRIQATYASSVRRLRWRARRAWRTRSIGRSRRLDPEPGLSALLFLYKEVLEVDLSWLDGIVRAKRPARLPVVLTREEVRGVHSSVVPVEW